MPLLANVYPGQIIAVVVVGAIILAAPLGIAVARALRRMLEDELADNYRRSERFYILAAAASQAGVLMASLGRGILATLGLMISAGGTIAAIALLLNTWPWGRRRYACSPDPADEKPVD